MRKTRNRHRPNASASNSKIPLLAKEGARGRSKPLASTSPGPSLVRTVDFRRNAVAASHPTRRRGMNSPAESRKSPLKGTPNLCLQSALRRGSGHASADFVRLSRGIHSPVTASPPPLASLSTLPVRRGKDVFPAERSRRYVLVGLGGIGGLVLRLLVPFLHSLGSRATVIAIDGDTFEERNRARMIFTRPGPKAVVLAEEMCTLYPDRVTILPVPRYLTPRSATALICEGDVVFCQPDNHATRRIVERRCARLRDVVLFSGGNDGVENGKTGTYGNVQVYIRANGRNVTNPPSRFHPEIAHPADRLPAAQGCAALMASAPQLLFTNAAVAAAMLGAFYAWRQGALAYEEAYLDILTGRMVPVQRATEGR